ncbi:threonine ammonia-lyase [Altericroceibacterium endophyticum]|uniref:Pyridoxal-phosphate dependent enzyme n=1 Tax=Altericroceibacterium endophyticum TaxID=1808508 RepID=A0A6I4T1G6_9SPHN|nr:pyridoxal-phosphate dependent enzyme [Altericroceibacterium endophyticum]MXO64776.1 pyridoxal-phosphate dependent enzyme [Altericroceibacterium endophyticum]
MIHTTLRHPTADGVRRASRKIARILPYTPLLPVEINGVSLWAKAECLQPVGAFKIRGGWHRLSDLSDDVKTRGVVGVSSGNHAQGVAWAARKLGIQATIVMPSDAPRIKMDRVREMGADIVTYERLSENREEIAQALSEKTGATYVHAFGDPWVIEGQGSAGIEIAQQMEERIGQMPSRLVVCCGGGGLTAGLALACPDAEIVPVEPEGWDDVTRSLSSGEIQSVGDNPPPTACDALQTLATYPMNFDILKARSCVGVTVTEAEVRDAQRFAFARLRLVLEPGGAVALAAALAGKVTLDDRTAILLTGGNVDAEKFAKVLTSQD